MAAETRKSSFSFDPGNRRGTRRERWTPLEPGKGDFKPRPAALLAALAGDDVSRRDIDEIFTSARR